MNTQRTSDELKNPDYNYYLAYSIDPSEKDTKKIETSMAQRKNTFTQGSVIQRRLKDLYAEAVAIMTDQAQRAEEHKNAKALKMETAKNAIVAIVRGRGAIYKSDLIKMADASGKWFTSDELEKEIAYLTQQGAKILDDTKRSLDFLTYDKVEKLLKTIGKNDLYDLLSSPANTAPATLQSAVTTLYNAVSGKTDPKSTATNQVCGEAKKIFKDASTQKYYDIYLATKDIWGEFALRRSTGISEIELKEFLAYSEKAKNALKTLGITNVDDIEVLLAEALFNYRISVAGGAERSVDLEDCPYCGMSYANIGNPKACPHCHQPLEIICWNCGGKAPNTVKKNTCPTCGASKAHSSRFDVLTKKIDNMLLQPDISLINLQTEINNLQNILPDYKIAPTSKLAKKANEYQEWVNSKIKEEETVGKTYRAEYEKVQELINLKKYMSASSAVATLKAKFPVYNAIKTEALVNTINAKISAVKQHAERAKAFAAQNSEETAIAEVASALAICTDYIEGKQIIAKFPPKAPQSVTTSIKENVALVNWTVSRPQNMVTFSVLRKTGSTPTSISEGTVVASELTINYFEDSTIASGTPYFYGVFASRIGVYSPLVCASAPIVTYLDVSNIRQDIVSGKIVVRWETPLYISEVEVIRKKGLTPPVSREDGQRISCKNNTSFEDSDYDNAGNSYLFICVYKSDRGVVNRSKGVTRTFKTYEELKPLSAVKIEQNGATAFTLTTEKISSGKLGVYISLQEINCKFGTTLQIAEFGVQYKNLSKITLMTAEEHIALFSLPADKTYFVYPYVYNEQLLIVSKPVLVNTMTAVKQISVTEPTKDSEIIITGQPHSLALNIVAVVSNTAFPAVLSSDGIKYSVTKEDFISGGIRLKLKTNAESFITLFAEIVQDGVKTVSFGVRLPAPISIHERVTVLYKMSENVSNTKSFPIKIDFQADFSTTIPPLTLVKGNPRPLSVNEGQLVDTTPMITLNKGLFSGGKYVASLSINSAPVPVNMKFAVFFASACKHITLKQVKTF